MRSAVSNPMPDRPPAVAIRDATADDWPAIWPIFRSVVAAGDTFSYDRDPLEEEARRLWMLEPPGRTLIAVAADGIVLGTAKMHPNHGGPAPHVATASFMVDPRRRGQGVGRALGEHVLDRARDDGFRAIQFNAVVETNAGAVALWRSLGFEVIGTVPEGFLHPDDGYVGLHIMHRRL